MSRASYKKALATLLRAEGLADDLVRRMVGNMATLHKDLRAMLLSSGMNRNDINRIMGSVEVMSEAFAAQMMADAEQAARMAYQRAMIDLHQVVAAFEVMPYGVAVPLTAAADFAIFNTTQLIQGVTQQMVAAIKTEVLQGVYLERRPFQVMQRISNIIGLRNMVGFREFGTTGISAKAERIVRTEMMAVMNNASTERLKDLQQTLFTDLKMVWLALGDWRTRDSHLAAHGQVSRAGGTFIVGGSTCEGPHDLTLPPEERINCRCRSVPHRDEWGKLDELHGDLNAQVERERQIRAGIDPTKVDAKAYEQFKDDFAKWQKGEGKKFQKEFRKRYDKLDSKVLGAGQQVTDARTRAFAAKGDTPGYKQAEKDYIAAMKNYDRAVAQKRELFANMLQERGLTPAWGLELSYIKDDRGGGIKAVADKAGRPWGSQLEKDMNKAAQAQASMRQVVPNDWWVHTGESISWGYDATSSMAYYSDGHGGTVPDKILRMGNPDLGAKTWTHEAGHKFEEFVPGLHADNVNYLRMRTEAGGWSNVGMPHGYLSGGVGWFDPYAGKLAYNEFSFAGTGYSGMWGFLTDPSTTEAMRDAFFAKTYATEVTSTYLSVITTGSYSRFLNTDPTGFDFLTGMLLGGF